MNKKLFVTLSLLIFAAAFQLKEVADESTFSNTDEVVS